MTHDELELAQSIVRRLDALFLEACADACLPAAMLARGSFLITNPDQPGVFYVVTASASATLEMARGRRHTDPRVVDTYECIEVPT